jgi:hypothetical protein
MTFKRVGLVKEFEARSSLEPRYYSALGRRKPAVLAVLIARVDSWRPAYWRKKQVSAMVGSGRIDSPRGKAACLRGTH